MSDQARWLEIRRGAAPLLLSLPHTGTELPEALEARLVSPWLARKDADWHIERLYEFAAALGATLVRTRISRTVIDVNRDPSGQSLYPGQFTTGLCPVETFDGEQLYRSDPPDDTEIAARRQDYFDPYHAALGAELQRLRQSHDRVVLYDCHSIRSIVPALFEGALPNVNIGTNSGASCDPAVTACLEHAFADGHFSMVLNGRFKGGWITRHYGRPEHGIHAIQIELACRGYIPEPAGAPSSENWPPVYDGLYAGPMRDRLHAALAALVDWAAA